MLHDSARGKWGPLLVRALSWEWEVRRLPLEPLSVAWRPPVHASRAFRCTVLAEIDAIQVPIGREVTLGIAPDGGDSGDEVRFRTETSKRLPQATAQPTRPNSSTDVVAAIL